MTPNEIDAVAATHSDAADMPESVALRALLVAMVNNHQVRLVLWRCALSAAQLSWLRRDVGSQGAWTEGAHPCACLVQPGDVQSGCWMGNGWVCLMDCSHSIDTAPFPSNAAVQ